MNAARYLLAMSLVLGCTGSDDGPGQQGSSSTSGFSSGPTGSVATDSDGGADSGVAPADSSGTTASTDDGGGTTGAVWSPIGVLTVTLATASRDERVVDVTPLQLCLTQDECFALGRSIRVGDGRRESGPLQFEVTAHDDVALSVQDVARFELRSAVDASFVPQCLSVSFDGVPALCTKSFDGALNTSASFAPDMPSDCVSCFDRDEDTELTLTHGPFVGARDAQTGTAHIWVRTDASRLVEVLVAPNPDMSGARLAASTTPSAHDDFTAELVVDALAAGGVYYYQLTVDGVAHAPQGDDAWHPGGVYSLRMPPPSGEAGQFTFALSSCARMFKHGNYDAVRDSEPAFWLNVGDYHYGNVLRTHFTDEEGRQQRQATTDELRGARDELRWWYRSAHWEKPTVLATVPLLNTWDDHDYGGGTEEAHGEHIGKLQARSAFLEYMANGDRAEAAGDDAVYFRSTHGDVDLFVLDPRFHRPELVPNKDGQLVAPDASADPLGAEQTDWLIDGLAASEATFKFVAAGTRFYGGSDKAWLPFLVARDALLARIVDEGITGVVFLAGGPHASEYRQFTAVGRTWHELGASPISSGLSSGTCSRAANQVACYDEIKNFLLLDVDTTVADPTVSARVMTFDGEQPWSTAQPVIVISRSMLD